MPFDTALLLEDLECASEEWLALTAAELRGRAIVMADDLSQAMLAFGQVMTEKTCRRILEDFPTAYALECSPRPRQSAEATPSEGQNLRSSASRPMFRRFREPITAAGQTVMSHRVLDSSGALLSVLNEDSPVRQWLALLTPIVGSEHVLLLLQTRVWQF
jgi:hypothetical protein